MPVKPVMLWQETRGGSDVRKITPPPLGRSVGRAVWGRVQNHGRCVASPQIDTTCQSVTSSASSGLGSLVA